MKCENNHNTNFTMSNVYRHVLFQICARPLMPYYSVMQSDRNSSKTDTFKKPTTYERHVQPNYEQKQLLLDRNTDE